MTQPGGTGGENADEPVTVTDNRKVDPETGEPRIADEQQADAVADDAAAQPAGEADAQVAELTEALQRERAQFANFRRRSAEEQLQAVDRGKQVLLEKLLPILDDLDRAREHGDLDEGPLRAFGDKFGDVLASEKLVKFAASGEVFDPELHEAIQNDGSGDTPVIGNVFRVGYRLGDKVIRHAMVTVTDPEPAPEQ